jgi:hypothetical protein
MLAISSGSSVVSPGAQSPDDALGIKQEIERISDVSHKYVGARYRLDGTALAHINRNRQPPGIPRRREPQPVVPAIPEHGNMFQRDACLREVIALEDIMLVGRDLIVQRERKALQLLARGFPRVGGDDMNVDELAELAKALADSIDEFAFARQRSRVVTAYRLDVQMTKAGDVDPDAVFRHAMPNSGVTSLPSQNHSSKSPPKTHAGCATALCFGKSRDIIVSIVSVVLERRLACDRRVQWMRRR